MPTGFCFRLVYISSATPNDPCVLARSSSVMTRCVCDPLIGKPCCSGFDVRSTAHGLLLSRGPTVSDENILDGLNEELQSRGGIPLRGTVGVEPAHPFMYHLIFRAVPSICGAHLLLLG